MTTIMRQHGAALVLVLWLIVLLAALIGAFALTARVEALQGSVLRASAQADEVARAGMEYGLWRLQASDPDSRWRADGRRYRWRYAGAEVELRLTDESGKVDLNNADANLLSALLRTLGAEPGQDQQLAAAILDWRDPDNLSQPQGGAEDGDYAAAGLPYGAKDAPFESYGELQRVLGMSDVLYRKLLPCVTLYSDRARPEPRFAPAPVLTALGLDAEQQLAERESADNLNAAGDAFTSGTFSIESRARLGDGREAVLRAVVRAGASPLPGATYTVLRWEQRAAMQ